MDSFTEKVPEPLKKKFTPLSKKDIVFALLLFTSTFLVVSLGFWGHMHLGFTVAYFVLFTVTSLYLYKKSDAFSIICGMFSLAGAVTFTLFNNYFVNTVMTILVAGLYVIYAVGISDSFSSDTGSFRILFDLLKSLTVNVFNAFGDIVGGLKATSLRGKKSLGGFIGVLCAIPVLIVIIPLLVSSDAAFEGLVKTIGKSFGVVLLQFAIALIFAPFLYAFVFEKKNRSKPGEQIPTKLKKTFSVSACTSFLAVISVVYLVYLFSQLAYFFSAFKGILPYDYVYTASTFARRGFFEMFAVCVINVAVVSVTFIFAESKNTAIKILSCFISLFSVLMTVIALRKMVLNVSVYGLSENRVLVTVFMIMLLVVIAFIILHIFAPKIKYMQPIIIICSALFITLSFADSDAIIARYNINAYESDKISDLDISAIADLSDSTVPYLVGLTENEDEDIVKCATAALAEIYKNHLDDNSRKDPRKFNLAKARAYKSVKNSGSPLLKNVLDILTDSVYFWYYPDNDEYEIETPDGTKVYCYSKADGKYIYSQNYIGEEMSQYDF